ncbi:recombinase family protein [Aliidiomarina sp. Khilg15.8]
MERIAYKRVSSVGQNSERQLDGMTFDREFSDECSGSTTDRPELQRLLSHVRDGDAVYVHSIDRMARDLKNLLELIDFFKAKGVDIHFVKEAMSFTPDESNPMQDMMLQVMGAVSQFERALILERQREGIAQAKARGAYRGSKKTVDRAKVLEMLQSGVKKTEIARRLGIGRASIYRVIRELRADGRLTT